MQSRKLQEFCDIPVGFEVSALETEVLKYQSDEKLWFL